eukprot:scaffold16383_cov72-Cylindrotheca_fusiformis.AAC.1
MDVIDRDYAQNRPRYPNTLDEAVEVMQREREPNKKKGSDNGDNTKSKTQKKKKTTEDGSTYAQSNRNNNRTKCYCCGSPEHLLPSCPEKGTKPRSEWFKPPNNDGEQQHTTSGEDDDISVVTDATAASGARSTTTQGTRGTRSSRGGSSRSSRNSGSAWNAFSRVIDEEVCEDSHHSDESQRRQDIELYESLMIDSGSTVDIVANPKFLVNIRESKIRMKLHTNVGTAMVTKEGEMPGFGTVKFHPDGNVNILGMTSLVRKGYQVKYDSDADGCIRVVDKKTKRET